jgi:hypothetical protein
MNSSATVKKLMSLGRLRAENPGWFMLTAGGILVLGSLTAFFTATGKSQPLDMPDPILGIPIRYIVLFVGIVELAIAGLCLFTSRKQWSLMLIMWLMVNLSVYRIGLWTMGWHHPYWLLGSLMEALNISPLMADGIISLFSAFLLIGSLILLCFGKGDQVAVPNYVDESLKMSCQFCGGHIKFATQNLGQKISCPHCQKHITLRKSDLLKMACFFCQEHIKFPAHAIGEKMPCPHCKMDITLKEPA